MARDASRVIRFAGKRGDDIPAAARTGYAQATARLRRAITKVAAPATASTAIVREVFEVGLSSDSGR